MKCNICGNKKFKDVKSRKNIFARKKIRCIQCHSLERSRLFFLYLKNIKIKRDTKILHLAPEKGLYDYLVSVVDKKFYITADLNPERYPFAKDCVKIDLCDLDEQSSSEYDLIMHMHIMEHTPCNIAYTLFHIHRMLKEDGLHICIIPFSSGKYIECFDRLEAEEHKRLIGQHDHVRKFGKDDIGSHLGKIINIPNEYNATKLFSKKVLRYANIPEVYWRGFHACTVLMLRKYDMKLLTAPTTKKD